MPNNLWSSLPRARATSAIPMATLEVKLHIIVVPRTDFRPYAAGGLVFFCILLIQEPLP